MKLKKHVARLTLGVISIVTGTIFVTGVRYLCSVLSLKDIENVVGVLVIISLVYILGAFIDCVLGITKEK